MTNEEFQALILQQLQALSEGQSRMENRIGNIENGQSRLEDSQDRLAEEVMAIKSELHGVKETVIRTETRIENEIETRIRALYEAREVHNDRFERIEGKLDSIATDVSYLVAKIAGMGTSKVAK